MGYNLTIDQGNSSAKIAIHDGNRIVEAQRIESLDAETVGHLLDRFCLVAAIYSSVSASGKDVVSALKNRGIRTITLSPDTPLPIAIDYKTPTTLGRDRIAVAVGAFTEHPGCNLLVVDAGTAVTYDVVTANGHYLGGNIAPGIDMRLSALHAYTERLPLVDTNGDIPLWGYDTATAIRTGAMRGIVAEIAYYRSHLGDNALVMLTGGNSDELACLADFPVEVDTHLVNKGLNSILLYNESK